MKKNITITTLDAYKEILAGSRSQFPRGTWDPSLFDGMQNFMKCFRYLILEVLNWSREDVLRNVDSKVFFNKYRLTSGLCMLFDGSPYAAIKYSFPEWDVKFWEMKRCPSNMWDIVSIRESLRWLHLNKLKHDKTDIISIDNHKKFLESHGMKYMLRRSFNILTMNHKRDVTIFDLYSYTFPEYNFEHTDFIV